MQTHHPIRIQISYQWLILILYINKSISKWSVFSLNHQGTVQVPSANSGIFSRPWCKSFECSAILGATDYTLQIWNKQIQENPPQNHENERNIAAKITNEPGHEAPKWLAVQAVKTVSSVQWQHQSEESLLRPHRWSAIPAILTDSRRVWNS